MQLKNVSLLIPSSGMNNGFETSVLQAEIFSWQYWVYWYISSMLVCLYDLNQVWQQQVSPNKYKTTLSVVVTLIKNNFFEPFKYLEIFKTGLYLFGTSYLNNIEIIS